MTHVAEGLREVQTRIARACINAGRDPQSVRLLAVSKWHSPDAIRAAYAAGQRDFGENYAQELLEKAKALSDLEDLRFHFIGNLQSNKAKLLAPVCYAVQTIAKESVARALHERVVLAGRRLSVMLQVNVAGEAQKAGIAASEVPALVARVREFSGLSLVGLMTIPPADDEQAARDAYRELAVLAKVHNLPQLSMGMSDDLELAIREGATQVRVGTAIFGERS